MDNSNTNLNENLNNINNVKRIHKTVRKTKRRKLTKQGKLVLILLLFIIIFINLSRIIFSKYKPITFTNFPSRSGENISLVENQNLLLEIDMNNIVYIDGKKTNIRTDYDTIYILNTDKDNQKEIISRTTSYAVAPPTNTYHIYKVDKTGDISSLKEIYNFSLESEINTISFKNNKIQIEYQDSDNNTIKKEYKINK